MKPLSPRTIRLALLFALLPACAADSDDRAIEKPRLPQEKPVPRAPLDGQWRMPHEHKRQLEPEPRQPWEVAVFSSRTIAESTSSTMSLLERPTKNAVAACDDNGFATKTGTDLVDHIRNAPTNPDTNTSCVNRLFSDAAESVRFAAYSAQNMIDVANATASLAVSYDGTNSTNLQELYLFLRAGYFNKFYNPDQIVWPSSVRTAMVGALDAFVANGHFFDGTDEHGAVLKEALISMDSAEEQARYVYVVKDWLGRWDSNYAASWYMRSAVNSLFVLLFRGHQQQAFRDVTAPDTALMVDLRDFATSTWMVGSDAEFMAQNAGRELARFLQYETAGIYSTAKSGVQSILLTYSMTGFGSRIWIATASVTNYYDDCNDYGTCGFEDELEQQILSVEHLCSSTIKIRAQQMSTQELADSCQLLDAQETYFHDRLATNYKPVAQDNNDSLEVVVFDSYDDYATYSWLFFGNSTNNGGIYLEGDPAAPGNQARFIAHEATWLPDFAVWNLEHEYVHYLDGRFNMMGGFGDYRTSTHKTVWWIEGLAEYISKKDDNPEAVATASDASFALSTVMTNTYNSGQTRIYTWGYLAVRFMFERHSAEVDQVLTYFRAGNYDTYLSYLDGSIGSSHDSEWYSWLNDLANGGGGGGSTPLANGVPATGLSVTTSGDELHFALDVPTDANDLSFTITGGTGDADLYVRFGSPPTESTYDCRPWKNGNEETCSQATPATGTWYAMVRAYNPFSGVTLTGSYTEGGGGNPGELQNGVPEGGLGAGTGEVLERFVWVPAGATDLNVTITGGTGDADLYVRFDAWPTSTEYDCRPYLGGNQETCSFASPSSGWWYVHLRGYSAFTGVTLTASFTERGGDTTVPNACISDGPTTSGQLESGAAICMGNSSQPRYYYVWVPAGTQSVTVRSGHGTGNADLLVRSGGWPTASSNDGSSAGTGNSESVVVTSPSSGWFYVAVVANPSFEGAALIVDLQ